MTIPVARAARKVSFHLTLSHVSRKAKSVAYTHRMAAAFWRLALAFSPLEVPRKRFFYPQVVGDTFHLWL